MTAFHYRSRQRGLMFTHRSSTAAVMLPPITAFCTAAGSSANRRPALPGSELKKKKKGERVSMTVLGEEEGRAGQRRADRLTEHRQHVRSQRHAVVACTQTGLGVCDGTESEGSIDRAYMGG